VEIVAKTHAAVQNIVSNAVTCDHWVRKHVRAGGVHCHTLVVEELTQIDVQLWADLSLCRFKGVAFVCSGDFGQFQPVCEHWSGCPVREGLLEASDMLYEMCGGNRLVLTENMRSDARLFDFYTNLGDDLQEALARARQMFPVTERPAKYILTMSHARRMNVNKRMNEDQFLEMYHDLCRKLKQVVIQVVVATNDLSEKIGQKIVTVVETKAPVQKNRAGNQPQTMRLWPGLQLIGSGHQCLKGMFYEVQAVGPDFVELTSGAKLTHEQVLQSLRLCYALTYASCQGLTLPGVVRLDTQSPNFTLKHLYVGISRATAADLVEVA
jgi:hypothetical protein